MRPSRNAATATSFAALNTHGNVPPRSPASRASASRRNVSVSGSKNSRGACGQVERRHARRRALRIGERIRDRHAHVRDSRDERPPRRRGSARARARSTSGARRPRCGSYGRPKRKCASITSSPLFASVAESIVIFAPMFQVGCASASVGRDVGELVARAAAERAAARGEDDRLRLAGERALEERRVLAVDRDQRSSAALARGERELARRNEALLVGERERHAALERPHRPGQPGEAERRVEDDVRLRTLEQLGRVASDLRQRGEPVDRRRARRGRDELQRGFPAITSIAWRPIDPVAPRSATRVMGTVCPVILGACGFCS